MAMINFREKMTGRRSATACKAVMPEDLKLNIKLAEMDEVIESFEQTEVTLAICGNDFITEANKVDMKIKIVKDSAEETSPLPSSRVKELREIIYKASEKSNTFQADLAD